MAPVTINTGEAYHEDRLAEAPREKWGAIIAERRYYLETNIDYDCRCLLQYVTEAEQFYAELGYDSAEAMVQEAYGIQPEQAWAAVAYLQGRQAAGPVGLAEAAAAARPLAQHGTNQHREQQKEELTLSTPKGGNGQAYLLRRLSRDAPEVLERVKAGEFKSARAAAIEAGIIKPVPTIRLVDDLEKVAENICRHLSTDQLVALATAIAQRVRDGPTPPPL